MENISWNEYRKRANESGIIKVVTDEEIKTFCDWYSSNILDTFTLKAIFGAIQRLKLNKGTRVVSNTIIGQVLSKEEDYLRHIKYIQGRPVVMYQWIGDA